MKPRKLHEIYDAHGQPRPGVVFPLSATPLQKSKRRINGKRALDYRRDGKRYARCSRCHAERDLSVPLGRLRGADDELLIKDTDSMAALMLGQMLLGFICNQCVHATSKHVVAIFPDSLGFPLVDDRGNLLPPSRCDDCGFVLSYSDDGQTAVCPQCDAEPAP